jgi:hypothetical protein
MKHDLVQHQKGTTNFPGDSDCLVVSTIQLYPLFCPMYKIYDDGWQATSEMGPEIDTKGGTA